MWKLLIRFVNRNTYNRLKCPVRIRLQWLQGGQRLSFVFASILPDWMVCVRFPLLPLRNRQAKMATEKIVSIEMTFYFIKNNLRLALALEQLVYQVCFVVMWLPESVARWVRYGYTVARTEPNFQPIACVLSCPCVQVLQVKSAGLPLWSRCNDVASV